MTLTLRIRILRHRDVESSAQGHTGCIEPVFKPSRPGGFALGPGLLTIILVDPAFVKVIIQKRNKYTPIFI